MRKVTMLGIVLVLLAVSVVPVMAKDHPNGHGNGASEGQGNSAGVNPGVSELGKQQNQNRNANSGARGNGNHGQKRMSTPFYLQGTISAIDPAAKTITVTLIHGNAQVKQYIGKDLFLQTSDATLFFQITQGNETESTTEQTATPTLSSEATQMDRVPITFDKLAVGQKVAIHGNLVNSVYTARLVTVYIKTPILAPTGN
jgi:hypothetical protein